MVPVVNENNTKTPPLVFGVREGVVVMVVTEKATRNPSAHVCSEGVVVVAKNRTRTPPLMFGVREGVVVVVVAKK